MGKCTNCNMEYEGDAQYCLECDLYQEEDHDNNNDLNEEPEDHIFKMDHSQPTSYMMKEDRYKDEKSSAWMFLTFGILGSIFVLLNVFEVFTFLNGIIPNTVMGALFIFFIYTGITSNINADKIHREIDTENNLTKDINIWLTNNLTLEFIEINKQKDLSSELNYLHLIDKIKEMITDEFGEHNPSYIDEVIEEFYVNTFENH